MTAAWIAAVAASLAIATYFTVTTRARRRNTSSLRASEARFRALTDGNPDAILVEGNEGIVFANASAAALLGVSHADALRGRRLNDFLDEAQRAIGRERFARVMAGEAISPRVFRFRRLDGAEIAVEGRAACVEYDGAPAAQVVLRDTTERHAAEVALAESEDRYRLLTEASYDVVLSQDERHRFTYVSPRAHRVLARSPGELLGCDLADFLHPDDAADLRRARQRWLIDRVEHPAPRAYRYRRPDGSETWIEGSKASHYDESGTLTRSVIVLRDITERRVLEERLRQVEKLEAVATLAGGIAHDVNNMLTIIRGSAEFVRDEGRSGDSEAVARDLRAIVDATVRGETLTRQLLTFSQRHVPQARLWPLDFLVEESVPLMRRVLSTRSRLDVVAGIPPLAVRADRAEFELALVQLVRNACESMPDGGTVQLAVDFVSAASGDAGRPPELVPRTYVRLAVQDHGTGLTPEAQQNLFVPFFTTKPRATAHGLGLATVYGVARRAGGTVTCESTPGEGSRFTIWLPAEPLPVVAKGNAPSPLRAAPSDATVLVVDDETTVRDLALRALERSGFHVVGASSGADALARLAQRNGAEGAEGAEGAHGAEDAPIDVVLTDFAMPGMSGLELLTAVAATYPTVRGVIMSGYADHDETRRMLEQSNTPFIAKPFTLGELVDVVRRAANERPHAHEGVHVR